MTPSRGAPGLHPAFRALGWGALAGAPVLLAALATVVSRPSAPGSVLIRSAGAAAIAGGLAVGASLLASRGARDAARRVGGLAVLAAIGFVAFLLWLALQLPG